MFELMILNCSFSLHVCIKFVLYMIQNLMLTSFCDQLRSITVVTGIRQILLFAHAYCALYYFIYYAITTSHKSLISRRLLKTLLLTVYPGN